MSLSAPLSRSAPTLPMDRIPLLGHAHIEKKIFSVYNGYAQFLINMPTAEKAPAPHPTSVHGNLFSPTYVASATSDIMFIPALNPWYGELFGPLNYKRSTLPIVQMMDEMDNGPWGLPNNLKDEWYRLEMTLRRVLLAMMKVNHLPRTKGTVPFGYPSRWSYLQTYRTENAARTVIFRAIKGFLPLIADLAMHFWFMSIRNNVGNGAENTDIFDLPDWRDAVCRLADIHPSWLDKLEKSAAGDLEIPRIGGIIDFSVPSGNYPILVNLPHDFQFVLPAIIASHLPMPLYIYWGEIKNYPEVFIPSGLKSLQFVPDELEITYLHRLPGDVAFSRWTMNVTAMRTTFISSCHDSDPYVAPSAASPALGLLCAAAQEEPPSAALVLLTAAPRPFPPVERYSGQREGEEMDTFFLRQHQHNTEWAARETHEDKQRRKQREDHAAKGQAPGHKGARVFIWEESNGHYIRWAAGHQNYNDYWDEFGPAQRRYDSYYDEWDLCERFGPEGDASDDEDHFGEEDCCGLPVLDESCCGLPVRDGEDEDDNDMLPEMLPDMEELEEGQLSPQLDIQRTDDVQSTPVNDAESDTSTSTSIASTVTQMANLRFRCTATKGSVQTNLDLPATMVVKKLLGDNEIVVSNETEWDNIRCFLAYCKRATTLADIPRPLLDFHQGDSDLYSEWAIQVRREILNNEVYYVIFDQRQQQDDLYILLRSATDALEIVRQGWGPSLREVMQMLLSRGITFMTCFRSTHISPGHANPRPLATPVWASNQRNISPISKIIKHMCRPRGRAALLSGGIIGRLAKSEVSEEEVLRGPSDDALVDGICLWDGHSTSAYWDDHLTDREIDLICGVYHVATETCMAIKPQLYPGSRDLQPSLRPESMLAGGHQYGNVGIKSASDSVRMVWGSFCRTWNGKKTYSWNARGPIHRGSKDVRQTFLRFCDLNTPV
ncbi:hypothetical protein C8R44DRAFT_754951 [Mycena epipterygia]|nr:hypothetical protein C8R44DRAFT_754951 [Mycena epipterygia]